MKKKRWGLYGAVIVAVFACAVLGWKITSINRKYPKQEIRQIQAGEEAQLQDDVTMRVEKMQWRTKDEAKEFYGKEFASQMNDGDIYQTMEVEIEVSNHSGQDQDIFLHDLYLEKGAFEQGLAPEIFYRVNDGQDMDFKLPGHTTRKITLGYVLYDFQFQNSQWKKLESLEFYLADTKYPVKTEWMLGTVTK